jgi:hypothetical protein
MLAGMSEAVEDESLGEWPDLPYQAWRDTRDTLHMCTQVAGKVRLALTAREPQWANVPLYLTARGLTTSPIWGGRSAFEIDFDLIDHQVAVHTAAGASERIPLTPRPVAEFYGDLMARLRGLGIAIEISPVPSEVPDPIPFADDTVHSTYDAAWAHRFFRVLSRIDLVMKEHRAGFTGRTSPVHFFWGSFDLALTRFSGRPADPPPGSDVIMRYSADAEQVCVGFWPGDARLEQPAFFAYAYPGPAGIEHAPVRPEAAGWNAQLGEFVLPYEAVRRSADPRRALLDFFESTYEAGASRLGWDPALVAGGAATAP